MTGLNTNSMWKVFAVVGGCAVILGVIWLFSSLVDTFRHITPSSNIAPSTSMEPYELDFATRFHSKEWIPESSPPLHWKLSVPHAFIVGGNGNSGVADSNEIGKRNFFRTDLQGVILPDNSGISPITLEPANNINHRFIAINIYNEPADPYIRSFDSCVTDDSYKKTVEALGAKNEHDKKCSSESPRCAIFSHLDGWYLEYTVSRDIYSDPEMVCRVAKDFLNKHTIHRDELR